MLSNLIITNQTFVFIIDELSQRERIAQKFIRQLLSEQGQDDTTIKLLKNGANLRQTVTFDDLLNACANNNNNSVTSDNRNNVNTLTESNISGGSGDSVLAGNKTKKSCYNVILPTLADLLSYQRPAFIFEFLNKLRKCAAVKRIFLWASTAHLHQARAAYILAACEHLADLILHLETPKELSIVIRKPGGGVTNKRYTYDVTKTEFRVASVSSATDAIRATSPLSTSNANDSSAGITEPLATFKIELDEDEMVARNALKLPYERTSEPETGHIIYTPDDQDDFDEEDPDEDLLI